MWVTQGTVPLDERKYEEKLSSRKGPGMLGKEGGPGPAWVTARPPFPVRRGWDKACLWRFGQDSGLQLEPAGGDRTAGRPGLTGRGGWAVRNPSAAHIRARGPPRDTAWKALQVEACSVLAWGSAAAQGAKQGRDGLFLGPHSAQTLFPHRQVGLLPTGVCLQVCIVRMLFSRLLIGFKYFIFQLFNLNFYHKIKRCKAAAIYDSLIREENRK